MSSDLYRDFEEAMLRKLVAGFAVPVELMQPPTRAETILHCWKHAAPLFDYGTGRLVVGDVYEQIEPITFELIRYPGVDVVEAEGVVVQRIPIVG